MRQGTDHSHHKGVIDYDMMVQSSEFDILKAGQGIVVDSVFEENRASVSGLMPWGAYWHYDNRFEPNRQAVNFLNALNGDLGDLPLFVDLEDKLRGQYLGWKQWRIFLEELQRLAPGKEILIYTNYYYWRRHCNKFITPKDAMDFFAQFDLWLAAYNMRPVDKQRIPAPFSRENFILWQYTESQAAEGYGVDKYEAHFIDCDWFTGTDAQWERFIGDFGKVEELFFEPQRIRSA